VELIGESWAVRVLFYAREALLASHKAPDVHFLLAVWIKAVEGKCSLSVLGDFPNEINDLPVAAHAVASPQLPGNT
jgi:hypothetical protein